MHFFQHGRPARTVCVALGIALTCLAQHRALAASAAPAASTAAASAAEAASPPDGEWRLASRTVDGQRFSPLTEIDRSNVANLKVAFRFDTGVNKGQEAAPIVAGDTTFIVTPYPNVLYALDLTKPDAPVKWKFEPKPKAEAQGVACCDVVNRGAAYADGRVFINTLDNQTIALDAATGRELWRAALGEIRRGETMTMAPLVVRDKVLVGNSGGELGVRGWLTALDAATGRVDWRAYSTGPDADVLIGPAFHPFYAKDRGQDAGVHTWPPEGWKIGGGTVWGWVTYDPELDLVYYGTANPGPWNPEQRPGANLFTSGVFARKPSTGEAVWYFQYSPHDLHDYDGVNEHVLVDLGLDGTDRKLLLHPDRNGYVYVMDRRTGQVISADPFVPVTTSRGVDLKTGELKYDPAKTPQAGRTVRDICPASPGGKDWQPSSWSPRTRLLYIPHQNLCQDAETYQVSYIAGTPYVGADVKMRAGPGGYRGVLTAWDPIARKPAWQLREDLPVWSGALATAGDVVFYGTMDGWFKAVDARDGHLLWRFKTESGVIGQPVSYRGPDGHQYIAVISGVGGWAGAIVTNKLDHRDEVAGGGFAHAMTDLPAKSPAGGTLYVFRLP
jgi:PQQ-dependent dehydrogenase (methanol/ethanol family)